MNPGQPSDAAAALYRGDAGRQYHEGKRALHPKALPWVMALRAEKFQRFVQSTDTVFEYGVGAGWNLGKLKCARRLGYDAADFLRPQVEAIGGEFVTDLSTVPGQSADVVLCHQTLEHLLDPAECLRQLQRILKPAGKLVLHVPWERERRYRHYNPAEPNHHLYTWHAQNLGNLVAVIGFAVEHVTVRKYGWDRFAANAAVKFRIGESGFRALRWWMIRLNPLLEIELVARR